jgi:hypothetical protein
LVEYPKSGVTWLSYLMANANQLLKGDARIVTFFNVGEFVPDIHASRDLAPPTSTGFGFRCIKSHAGFTSRYDRVFYLVRDPRHVMASYFRFSSDLGIWNGSFEDFVRNPEFGIGAWNAHVDGWLTNIGPGAPFTLIKYEDLLADTAGTMSKLFTLLGFKLSAEQLAHVVERSSAKRMREDEALFNAGHPKLGNFSFVRKEGVGGARVPVPDAVRAHIETVAGNTMRRLGYKT